MHRRYFLSRFSWLGLVGLGQLTAFAHEEDARPVLVDEQDWSDRMSYLQYSILVSGETEDPGSSPLNDESREGVYRCLGCGLDLFQSAWKYDSNTGWPSFWDVIPDHVKEIKIGLSMIGPVEYRCARCGGHHGHVFNDGPQPTGKRYCNNGAVLVFEATRD